MTDFTQDGRAFRLTTPLGPDVLLLQGFTTREAISRPYVVTVDASSTNPSITADELLLQPVSIAVFNDAGEEVRSFHGVVRAFTRTGRRAEFLTGYRLEMVPDFWFLSLTQNLRIFQDKTVPEIVELLLGEHGVDFDSRLRKSYTPAREYCVQYRESTLAFISRLLEAEGIHYYFEHDASGHLMVLGDTAGDFPQCPGQETANAVVSGEAPGGGGVITSFIRNHRMHSAGVTLADFNFRDPGANTRAAVTADNAEALGELYDYPGDYHTRIGLERYADLRLRALEQGAAVGRGAGTCRAFRPGTRFALQGHEDRASNGDHLLTEVTHSAYNGSYTAGDDAEAEYSNEFAVVRHPNDFRPPRVTPIPVVAGPQTATVVGPSGEEIHVDSFGRVKVQFHWDREGQKDDASSCWIRVMTNTAGNRWGMVHIPRINQEVVVTFLEGNPDRPLITGAVYNQTNQPPYTLPEHGLVQGLKTRTSPGGEGYNELILDDRKDRQLIRMHAQRNLQVKVLNTESHHVGNHMLYMIKGVRGALIEGETMIQLEEPDEEGEVGEEGEWDTPVGDVLVVTSNRYVEIGKANGMKCEEGHFLQVVDGEIYSVIDKGDHTEEVTEGDHSIKVETGDQNIEVTEGNHLTEVTQGNIDIKAKAGGITIDGSDIITLKSGGASIKMGPTGGIELKFGSSSIKINAQGIEMKGPKIKGKADVQVELDAGVMAVLKGGVLSQVKAPIVKVDAAGILLAKGSLTKIN